MEDAPVYRKLEFGAIWPTRRGFLQFPEEVSRHCVVTSRMALVVPPFAAVSSLDSRAPTRR